MEHFFNTPPQADEAGAPGAAPPGAAPPGVADPGIGYIFAHTRGKKCLVFTTSREECETVCQTLRQYCEAKREPDRFLIHHGNLSASYRESAEEEMKDDDSLMSVCATATLELGIDIGRLERAFQIDAPFTVSGFLQRMGRTGRRGQPSEMWFVMREDHPEPRAMLPETIPYAFLALERFLKLRCGKRLGLSGLAPSWPYYIQFTMRAGEEEFYRITAEEAGREFDPMELIYPRDTPVFEKYDEYVPTELPRKDFALGVLDVTGMRRRVLGWTKSSAVSPIRAETAEHYKNSWGEQ